MNTEQPKKQQRGFAVMAHGKVSAIASKGGKAAHQARTAHEFTREEAREAGRLGGISTAAKRKAAKEAASASASASASESTESESASSESTEPRFEVNLPVEQVLA